MKMEKKITIIDLTLCAESLNFQVEKSGFISAIPYLTMGILLGVAGYLADWTQVKGWLTTTQVNY